MHSLTPEFIWLLFLISVLNWYFLFVYLLLWWFPLDFCTWFSSLSIFEFMGLKPLSSQSAVCVFLGTVSVNFSCDWPSFLVYFLYILLLQTGNFEYYHVVTLELRFLPLLKVCFYCLLWVIVVCLLSEFCKLFS